jgi:ArsR family transcriptional regulator
LDAIPDGLLHLLVRRLRLLADPIRVRLLVSLEHHDACVQELADALDATPQNVSHHLGALHRDGVVSRRKRGTTVIYALSDYSVCRVLEQALASVSAQLEELSELLGSA